MNLNQIIRRETHKGQELFFIEKDKTSSRYKFHRVEYELVLTAHYPEKRGWTASIHWTNTILISVVTDYELAIGNPGSTVHAIRESGLVTSHLGTDSWVYLRETDSLPGSSVLSDLNNSTKWKKLSKNMRPEMIECIAQCVRDTYALSKRFRLTFSPTHLRNELQQLNQAGYIQLLQG